MGESRASLSPDVLIRASTGTKSSVISYDSLQIANLPVQCSSMTRILVENWNEVTNQDESYYILIFYYMYLYYTSL